MIKDVVPFWNINLGEEELDKIRESVMSQNVSQGEVTKKMENRIAEVLNVPYVVLTTSGSVALYLAISSVSINPDDEILIPNRTFVGTAHAVLMAGGRVKLIDTHATTDNIDVSKIEEAITPKVKGIIPVHLNGKGANMDEIKKLAQKYDLWVIEDACQAFYSCNDKGFLGTQSDFGCFSLGITKLITTGQGGFVVAHDEESYIKLVKMRNHGVHSTFDTSFSQFGFNFKYNDVLASIGLVQIEKLQKKKEVHNKIYDFYRKELKGIGYLRFMDIDQKRGEIPLWVETLCSNREKVIEKLKSRNIQTRPFLPDLHHSPHLNCTKSVFTNSELFEREGLYLPSGADQTQFALERTVEALHEIKGEV